MVSIGMSNTRSAFNGFLGRPNEDAGRKPRLLVVNGAFPAHARVLQARLEGVVRSLRLRFPNLQLAYLSSRTRADTVAPSDLSPEPYAFETDFSVRWLIEKQLSGDASLNSDAAAGPVVAPILLRGPVSLGRRRRPGICAVRRSAAPPAARSRRRRPKASRRAPSGSRGAGPMRTAR